MVFNGERRKDKLNTRKNNFRTIWQYPYLIMLFWWIAGVQPVWAQQTGWTCVKNDGKIQVYTRKSDTLRLKIVKATTVVHARMSSLVAVLIDAENHKNWVFLNKKAEVLKKLGPFHWILYSQSDAPWPVTDRDVVSNTVMKQDSVTKAITVTARAVPEYIDKVPGHVRIPYARAQWRFIPMSKGEVRVVFTLQVDMGGAIPVWLMNMASAKGPYKTLQAFTRELQKKKYREAHLCYIAEP